MRCLVSILVATVVANAFTADGARINGEIRAAIAAGQPVYVCPAGVLDFSDQQPWIPPGTSNFTVRGNPAGTTFFVPSARDKLFEVGDYIDNMGLQQLALGTVPAGAKTILTTASPGYYALVDDHAIRNRYGTGDTRNRGEIIRLDRGSRGKGMAINGAATGRTYNVNPKLLVLGNKLCRNIAIENITFEGSGSQNMLSIGLVDGLKLTNLQFRGYRQGACNLYFCRNVVIDNCRVDYATPGVGQGYGIIVARCRFVQILKSDLASPAAVRVHSGTMDTLIQDCTLNAGGDAVNTHGYDELRLTCRRLTGNGAITLGNDAWLAGGSGHLVEDCVLATMWVGPNVTNTTIRNSAFHPNGTDSDSGSITFSTMYPVWIHPNANPLGGRPSGIKVENCTFNRARNPLQASMWYDADVSFSNCTFTASAADWGNVFKLAGWAQGSLTFSSCKFISYNAREMFDLATGASAGLNLQMNGCQFLPQAPASNVAMIVRNPFAGSMVMTNNTFYPTVPTSQALFMVNESSTPLPSAGMILSPP
jgi:hypothetical protein